MLKRNDIIERLALKGYTKKDAGVIIDDVIKIITEAMVEGESVQLHGFGTFDVKEFKPRETVDLKTKERIVIPAYKAPKFTAGKLLKRAVKEGFIREQVGELLWRGRAKFNQQALNQNKPPH